MGLPHLGFLLPSEKHVLAPHTCSKGRKVKDVGVIEKAVENEMRKGGEPYPRGFKGPD